MNILVEIGIVIWNKHYHSGSSSNDKGFCYGYKININYLLGSYKQPLSKFEITLPYKEKEKNKNKKSTNTLIKNIPIISTYKQNKLLLDLAENIKDIRINEKFAIEKLDELLYSNEINIATHAQNIIYINDINTGNLHYSIGKNNNRISSRLTYVKSELRQFLNINGYYFNEMDIKSSQPMLLSNLLKDISPKYHDVIKNGDIYNYIGNLIKTDEDYIRENKIIRITKFHEGKDGKNYVTVGKNDIYNYHEIPRSVIKVLLFQYLFSNCSLKSVIHHIFNTHFKEIINVVNFKYKKDLAVTLQRLEASIFNTLSQILISLKIKFFTVYDSIYFLEQDQQIVIDNFELILNQFEISNCKYEIKTHFIPIVKPISYTDSNICLFNKINSNNKLNVFNSNLKDTYYHLFETHFNLYQISNNDLKTCLICDSFYIYRFSILNVFDCLILILFFYVKTQ
jgi:hypothetical protein